MKVFTNNTKRNLGHQLIFPHRTVSALLSKKNQILESLYKHSCICIKNVDLQERDMVQFTQGIWGQTIELPAFLTMNNRHPVYKQVARVGNVLLDGTLKDSQKEADEWHQDGDFWGEDKKHIFNCLHTREIPQTGGETHVMDLVEGAAFLKKKKPEIYENLSKLLGYVKLEEIKSFALYGASNTLNIDSVTYHDIVKRDKKKGQQKLYLSVSKLVDRQTKQPIESPTVEQILTFLETEMGFYSHKWEEGDLLIWDNTEVTHRSSGKFNGRRLLFRTQGRFA